MRTRRPWVRGTRYWSGTNSGVSIGTTPSGVTIDQYGITTNSTQIDATELDYLDGIAGYSISNASANKLLVSGTSAWLAEEEVRLVTGLTTVDALIASVVNVGGPTQAIYVQTKTNLVAAGYVSASLRYDPLGSGAATPDATIAAGCSITFLAIGS